MGHVEMDIQSCPCSSLFLVLDVVLTSPNRARYTFPSGGSATPSGGRWSGRSRRATPIRLSAIP